MDNLKLYTMEKAIKYLEKVLKEKMISIERFKNDEEYRNSFHVTDRIRMMADISSIRKVIKILNEGRSASD